MKKEHMEIIMEEINGKLDLVIEGHFSLNRKIDNVYENLNEKIEINTLKLDALNQKIDAVAADLSVHRADTEAHKSIYTVKED